MRIGLVVGHSASKQGASNKAARLTEYTYNNFLAIAILTYLKNDGPGCDPFIHYRAGKYRAMIKSINAKKPGAIISLHCNAYNTSTRGFEILYSGSEGGLKLADTMHSAISTSRAVSTDRGIKSVSITGRGGGLLHRTRAPCVILEPFFIDNNAECTAGTMHYMDLAESIAKGILKL